MRQVLTTLVLAFLVTLAFSPVRSSGDEGKKDPATLVGTWKFVSGKYDGNAGEAPEGQILKHVTPTSFCVLNIDKDGKITSAIGGSYTATADAYNETPEYGLGDVTSLMGKVQNFKWSVDGNKWRHSGKLTNGTNLEEVWERVEKK